MASVALGLIGGFLFGPAGYLVGSLIGSLLDPAKQEGPRLQSLKLQVSQYGDMIKDVWGADRIAGNVIWIGNGGNLVEHKHESGGKGGPQVTTYTYTASFGVGLCNRVGTRDSAILGILRIWADSRLIWGKGVSDDSAIPITIYLGTETQGADPTMEADLGAFNVQGYRGTAYVVFTDWDLSQFFNRIPNLEFEVYTAVDPIPVRVSTFNPAPDGVSGIMGASYDATGGVMTVGTYVNGGGGGHPALSYSQHQFTLDGTATGSPIVDQLLSGAALNANVCYITNSNIACFPTTDPGVAWYVNGARAVDIIGGFWPYGQGVVVGDFLYCSYGPPRSGINRYPLIGGVPAAAPDMSVATGSAQCFGSSNIGRVYVLDSSSITEYDAELNVMHTWSGSDFPSGFSISAVDGFNGFVRYNNLFAFSYAGLGFDKLNLLSVAADNTLSLYPQPRSGTFPDYNYTRGPVVTLTGGYVLGLDGVTLLDPPVSAVTLAEIVTDISGQCGLTSSQIDVGELTDLVDGFVIGSQMTGRNRIEPLRNAYFFDGVESDAKVKFPKRGRASIVTIPDDELAAFETGTTPPPQLTNERAQEFDLPQQLTVEYINKDADYQTGSQIAQRQVTQSQSKVSIQLPISMSDSKGLTVANVILDSAWAEREKYTIVVPRKYAYLDPADVITTMERDFRLLTREETGTTTIKFEAVQELAAVYTQASTGITAAGMPPATPPTSNATTDLLLLDLPLIADSDAPQSGFYSAMGPDGGGPWPGATLMRSIDSGVSYSSLLVDKQADTIGTTSDALGLWDPDNNIFDEVNGVTVVLTAGGALSGASETAVLNGANMAAIGSEIIQFKNATLVSANTYTLSGLLRGRRGTEWAIAGHGIGDAFVMLPVDRADVPLSELNQVRDYKGVTAGQLVSAASMQSFVNTGFGLKPYTLVQLGGGIDGSGNATLTGVRRTRIGGDWAPFVDVPLSEPTEQYVWQIWNADYTQVARIITTVVPTAAYSSADQVTDFGATQANIFFSVAQVGSIGIGTQANGSIVGAGGSNNDPLAPIPPYQSPTSGSPSPAPPPDSLVLAMGWANVRKLSSSAGTFNCSHIVVASFTTPAGSANGVLGWIAAGEWIDGKCFRYASLSTVAGDFSPGALALVRSQTPTIFFSVGTNTDGYPQLSPSTTYYFNVANSDGFGVCTCMTGSCGIFVELKKPSGL